MGAIGSPQLTLRWGAGADRTGPWWTYAILVAAIGFPVIALIGFFMVRATRMAGMNARMPGSATGDKLGVYTDATAHGTGKVLGVRPSWRRTFLLGG